MKTAKTFFWFLISTVYLLKGLWGPKKVCDGKKRFFKGLFMPSWGI